MTIRILILIAILTTTPLQARDFYGYTEEKPLTVVCDWDFRPFEYLDSEGKPTGYNVEVLDLILTKLDIPHHFVMREWHEATAMFERRDADLIHALSNHYRGHGYLPTKKYINYYNIKVARLLKTPPLAHLSDLDRGDTLMVKQNDYADLSINALGDSMLNISYRTPKDALRLIRTGRQKYYLWGEIPLARKIQELHLDSIVLDPIDIPAGELRIIGYDQDIIDVIDDEFTRLEQAGELQPLYDKWFHPERQHDDASALSLYVLAAVIMAIIVFFLLSRIAARRLRMGMRRHDELNSMMRQALGMGNYYVVGWDLRANTLKNLYRDMLPENGMPPQEFLDRMPPDEAAELHRLNYSLIKGEIDKFEIKLSMNKGTKEKPEWRSYFGNAILERAKGQPQFVLYTAHDITAEIAEERSNALMANKYKRVFETNLVAMSFYDTEGRLIDVNQKMHELCELHDENSQRFFREGNIFENPFVKDDLNPADTEPFHICQHMRYPAIGIDKYIEMRITPTVDDNGRMAYYVVTARDVTIEREMYRRQLEHDRQLHKTKQAINLYEEQLRYLLEESNMHVWYYYIKEQRIDFSHSLRQADFSETLEEYFAGIKSDHREQAMRIIQEHVLQGKPFTTIHQYDRTPISDKPAWYSLGGMPITDPDGQVRRYFGIARNITDLMQAQQLLRQETERAEDSGRLKAAFLANMTHEIRTPLNAIVGFSDLLQMVETSEERMEFIRIIRNNCDMLLRLINDILEASNLGQSMTSEPEEVDIAKVFDDICQTLEQRVQQSGVPFQKDNPYPTFPAVLDRGRIQQVLTNFVTNAVKYTHEGHIRVGYREQDDGIYFYCEDTGAGIPKDKQASVFERFVKLNDFVQGTGLGLSICQTIAQRCGGHIGVTSEGEGKGSTFWLWTPRVTEPQK
jgi:signal transduction histidine kinase